jgi:hypothetical protein
MPSVLPKLTSEQQAVLRRLEAVMRDLTRLDVDAGAIIVTLHAFGPPAILSWRDRADD